ncbi:hypothetical protein HHL17_14620 [Chitinophaga sp. G-6-1-13]|uniref:Uncharacterized protein n=1 Tax=Chitinophaga fulva TaxID=2728842 RepID=A0A848GM48_9BACT|nr:hypothetical protein [Chitinophaga fulva]NML38439.1 hypothetical protein [Chitinophaga fulva]
MSTLSLPADTSMISQYHLKKELEVKECIAYQSKLPDLLRLYGQSFSGSMGQENDEGFGFSNYVSLFITPENNKIGAYALHTETKDKTAVLDKLVNEKMGKTDYYYRSKEFTHQVWYKDGSYYFLTTNSSVVDLGQKTTTGDLTVINEKSPVFLDWFTSGAGFSYYGEYLKEKKKPEHQGKSYSYKDFIKEEREKGTFMGTAYFDDYVQ